MPEPHAQPRPSRRRVPRSVWFVVVCVALGAMTSVGVAWGVVYRLRSAGDVIYMMHRGRWQVYPQLRSAGTWAVTVHTTRTLTTHKFEPDRGERKVPLRTAINSVGEFEAAVGDAASSLAMDRHLPLLRSADREYVRFDVDLAGWPFRCLAAERACDPESARSTKQIHMMSERPGDQSSFSASSNIANTPIDLAFFMFRPHYHGLEVGTHLLPTFPLWPGLLANTAIYAAAWAVIITATSLPIRWFVRRRRARRGGCPQCGYSREGLKADAPCPECGRTTPAAHDATPTAAAR